MPEPSAGRLKQVGLPPGTLVHVGEKRTAKVRITVIDYDEAGYEEKEVESVEECFPYRDTPTVTWINVDGIHQVDIIERIGAHFRLHPLLLEDVVNTYQRPRFDDYGDHMFAVLKMLYYSQADEMQAEQVSLVVGRNYVISFQEWQGDVFEPVRERIRGGKGRIRRMGADYLAYSLIDAIVDTGFLVLEAVGGEIEALEEQVLSSPGTSAAHEIFEMKEKVLFLRRSLWPMRDVIGSFGRSESAVIRSITAPYFRDVYSNVVQLVDTLETHREMLTSMLEVHVSVISNRLNEIMKVLTIIATIFMPLTFVASIYGMNFAFMPPKDSVWGYPAVLLLMAAIAGGMAYYFRRKKWI